LRPRPPPLTRVALAHGAGVALSLLAATPSHLAASLTLLTLLLRPWRRPHVLLWPVVVFVGWSFATQAADRRSEDCRWSLPEGEPGVVVGWFESRPGAGAAPFQVVRGPCRARVRAVWTGDGRAPGTGEPLVAEADWRRSRYSPSDPERAGTLGLSRVRPADAGRGDARPGHRTRIRAELEARITRLFPQSAGLVDALLLAGRSGLDRELRERFALAGVVHLLAISGFHVGVVAGVVVLLATALGAPPPRAGVLGVIAVGAYVTFLGFPAAATRAALLLAGLALARLRGSPASGVGLLSTAFVLLLLDDPLRLADPGFQLSFAGALGLALGSRPLRRKLARVGLPRWLADGTAAGVAATLPTVPLVAWHFGRVSLIGVGATLLVTPLFSLAIPWTLFALGLSWLPGPAAGFVAGAAEALLLTASRLVEVLGGLPGIAPAVSTPALLALGVSCAAAAFLLVRVGPLGRPVRVALALMAVAAGVGAAPVLDRLVRGDALEIVLLDVGQGDAILVRTPAGRWIAVDAGPRTGGRDAGADVVVPFLRRRGVDRVERLYFSHADTDHIGGGPAVVRALEVGAIVDPGHVEGKATYLELLEAAGERGVPWRIAERAPWAAGPVRVRVLATGTTAAGGVGRADTDTNASSVVMLLEYGAFRMLLTGDAPDDVEARLVDSGLLGDIDVLKVGHHGSATSTSWPLLRATTPELAVISVGRSNRYGHPHDAVLERLGRAGVRVERTDRSGDIRILAGADGRWEVRTGRAR